MSNELTFLTITAVSIGFFHTLLGPDHYIPFIALSKSQNWSIKKTSFITFLCGFGHILGSVILGIAGLFLSISLAKIEAFEVVRGNLAGWLLLGFGLAYFIWGVRKAYKKQVKADKKNYLVPWTVFIVFILGPCEPLIPILMYPAATQSMFGLFWVSLVFGITTIATMMAIVLASSYGFSFVPVRRFERYAHAFAGLAIFLSGFAIQFLGL